MLHNVFVTFKYFRDVNQKEQTITERLKHLHFGMLHPTTLWGAKEQTFPWLVLL